MGWSSSKTSSGGGVDGVQSVTGLNTDNTDPTNPIVQVSVDNDTILGAGTTKSPLSTNTLLGSFNSTIIQNLVSANVGQKIQMENTTKSNGISVVGLQNDGIQYAKAGIYQLNFSIQFNHNSVSSIDSAYVWLNYNGLNNIPNTTKEIIVRPNNPFVVLGLSYIINILTDLDTIHIVWTADSTDVELYFASAPILSEYTDIPSIIVNSFRI